MTMSERIFYFQSESQAREEDREKWRRLAQSLRESEIQDAEDQRRRNAAIDERDRIHALEKRHAIAAAYLRRLPFDRVPTIRAELSKVVGHPLTAEGQRPDEQIHRELVAWIWKERYVYEDGITYPDTVRLAQMLACKDRVSEWIQYLSLPHVMLAEDLHWRLTNFVRYGPPQHPNSKESRW